MNKKLFLLCGMILLVLISLIMVSADIIWSDKTETIFKITDISPVCDNGFFWVWWNNDTGEEIREVSINDCFRPNGWPSTVCCPPGEEECILDPASPKFNTCQGLPAPKYCSDYNAERYGKSIELAESYCNNYSADVAIRTIEEREVKEEGFCSSYQSDYVPEKDTTCSYNILGCFCIWNDGQCKSGWYESNLTCPGDTKIIPLGNCTYSIIEKIDDCNATGYITYKWNAIWNSFSGEPEPALPGEEKKCIGGERRLLCIDITKLSFFTIATLIAAIVLIVIIYFLIVKKKKMVSGRGKTKRK